MVVPFNVSDQQPQTLDNPSVLAIPNALTNARQRKPAVRQSQAMVVNFEGYGASPIRSAELRIAI